MRDVPAQAVRSRRGDRLSQPKAGPGHCNPLRGPSHSPTMTQTIPLVAVYLAVFLPALGAAVWLLAGIE